MHLGLVGAVAGTSVARRSCWMNTRHGSSSDQHEHLVILEAGRWDDNAADS